MKQTMEPRYIDVKKYKEWNVDLKVDFKGIFKAVAKGFAAHVLPDPSVFVDAAADAFDAIKITVDHGVSFRAYTLIYTAMRRSLLYLVESPDHQPAIAEAMPPERFETYDAQAFEEMVNGMQALFDAAEEKEFKIYVTFFQHPEQIAMVGEVRSLFEEWLQRLGLSEVQAGHIGARLGAIFVRMLNEVWREKPGNYNKIREVFDDVFPEEHLHEHRLYQLKLREEWERPVFDETFGLEQIYLPLRAGYLRLPQKSGSPVKEIQVADAESLIKQWIESSTASHKIKVLKGGPGSGKSSLMKKLAFEMAALNRQPVYFIELQHISFETSVDAALKEYFARTFSHEVFGKGASGSAKRPVLVFDGLDELSASGKSGLEVAKVFIDDLIKLVDRLGDDWQPRVIITGRNLLLEPFEREFSEEAQVLELLPYRLEQRSDNLKYSGPKAVLEDLQVEAWWRKYLKIKKSSLPMPAFLKEVNFEEIVAQPLLNFLMALSYISGEIAFEAYTNPNVAYHHLMTRVLKRPWGKHKHLKWTVDEFLEVMEEVATSAWHHSGDVRVTTIEQVKARCKENEIVRKRIEELEQHPDSGYLRLLAAFYFKGGSSQSSDKTFEFTHKSFGEYLVARRLLTLARHIQQGLGNPKYYNSETAKKDWLSACAQSEVTGYIWPFIERQVALEYNGRGKEAASVQEVLSRLFSDFITNGFEPGKELTNSLDIIRASRNAESSLLLMISAFARVSGKQTNLGFRDADHPKRVFSRMMLGGGGLFGAGLFRVAFPEWVDLSTLNLSGADLSFANLSCAYLADAYFARVSLTGADLTGADLTGADLSGADLSGADLSGAELMVADLSGANLTGADLTGADLAGADFYNADLPSANLDSANLDSANLDSANLENSKCYPFHLGDKLLDGPEAYQYLIDQGALNVPKPAGMP